MKLKEFISNFFHLINFKNAIKTALAACLAWILVSWYAPLVFHRPNVLISGVWCVLTSVIVLQANIGGTFRAALNRFFGTFIGALVGSIVTSFLGSDPYSLGLGVFITVVFCSIFHLEDSYRIASASVAVVIILWKLNPEINPWAFSFFRFMDSTIGIIVALFVAHFIWPSHATISMQKNIAEILRDFKQLMQMVLKLEEPDPYHHQRYLDLTKEILEDLQSSRKSLDESQPEMLINLSIYDEWALILSDLDRIFENISDLEAVYRESTKQIFSPELAECLEKISQKIYQTMEILADLFEKKTVSTMLPPLDQELSYLNEQLLLFRSTHRMRDYSFDQVENFYVFTFAIKSLLQNLHNIENRLAKIHSQNTEVHFLNFFRSHFLQSNQSSKHSEN